MQRLLKRRWLTAALVGAIAASPLCPARAEEQQRAPIRDERHEVEVYIPSWKELRQRNCVMQTRDYSCGAAALATVLRYYWGDRVGEEDILQALFKTLTPEERQDRFKHGLAISDLRRVAVDMGYLSTIGTISLEQLSQARAPVVVALKIKEYDHFVVYRGMCDGRVYLADPIRGNVRPTIPEFNGQWIKNAILVVVKPDVTPPAESLLSVRVDEVGVGDMSAEMLRKQLPEPFLHRPQ